MFGLLGLVVFVFGLIRVLMGVDCVNCFGLICGLPDGLLFDLRSLYCLLVFGVELLV